MVTPPSATILSGGVIVDLKYTLQAQWGIRFETFMSTDCIAMFSCLLLN
jgi:hypothetical protein